MSWDVELVDEYNEPVSVGSHTEGSNYCVGGNSRAEMSVTYNYSQHYYDTFGELGFRGLDGMSAIDTLKPLAESIQKLGANRSGDYWESTPGNAGHVLCVMLAWASQNLDATWRIT